MGTSAITFHGSMSKKQSERVYRKITLINGMRKRCRCVRIFDTFILFCCFASILLLLHGDIHIIFIKSKLREMQNKYLFFFKFFIEITFNDDLIFFSFFFLFLLTLSVLHAGRRYVSWSTAVVLGVNYKACGRCSRSRDHA